MSHRARETAPLFMLAGVLLATYLPTFQWMLDRWRAPDSTHAHGFLVPLICAGWVYARRARIAAAPIEPAASGIVWVVAGMGMHAASVLLSVHFTSAISGLLVLVGAILYLRGPATLRAVLAPVGFLAFMIPVPLFLLAHLTLRLKLLATGLGVSVLHGVGLAAAQEGSVIHVGAETLMVGDACSGLRSLFALLALGYLVVQRLPASPWFQGALYLLVIPLAVAGNVARIVVLCLLAHAIGADSLGGFVHDATGLLIYVVTLAGLLLGLRLAQAGLDAARRPTGEALP